MQDQADAQAKRALHPGQGWHLAIRRLEEQGSRGPKARLREL